MLWLPLPLGEGWGEGNTLLLPKKIRVPAPRCHSRSPAYSLQGQAFKLESMAMPFDYAGVNPVLREVNSLFARNTGLGAGWCRTPKLGVPTCGLGGIGCTGFPLKYCGNGGGGRMGADGGWERRRVRSARCFYSYYSGAHQAAPASRNCTAPNTNPMKISTKITPTATKCQNLPLSKSRLRLASLCTPKKAAQALCIRVKKVTPAGFLRLSGWFMVNLWLVPNQSRIKARMKIRA